MSESVITQCPHCSTSFRVNDAQLGAANGAVRCGTCLKVFNALQHQVGGAPRANAPSAAEAKPAAAPPPAPSVAAATSAAPPAARPRDETLWIHDDLDLDSLNLDEELAKLDEFELNQEVLQHREGPATGGEPAGAPRRRTRSTRRTLGRGADRRCRTGPAGARQPAPGTEPRRTAGGRAGILRAAAPRRGSAGTSPQPR